VTSGDSLAARRGAAAAPIRSTTTGAGKGLVLPAMVTDRDQVHERRGAPGAVLPRA